MDTDHEFDSVIYATVKLALSYLSACFVAAFLSPSLLPHSADATFPDILISPAVPLMAISHLTTGELPADLQEFLYKFIVLFVMALLAVFVAYPRMAKKYKQQSPSLLR